MMKTGLILCVILLTGTVANGQKYKTLYDFKVTSIDGKTFDMSTLKGKKVLIVNTASKCGFTHQYKDLETLYKKYGGSRFEIIAFPENNFLNQEPGTNSEIAEFCQRNYGVTFPVMAKISVKGRDIAPIYEWLTSKSENGVLDAPIKWNFQKFMIDENGKVIGYLNPAESPLSDKIIQWLSTPVKAENK